jgi:RNA polymerase sigma-70 factor (ECF subfamily)
LASASSAPGETDCFGHGSFGIVNPPCPSAAPPIAIVSDDPAFLSEAPEEAAARDLELMLLVKAGDLAAFEQLVEIHQHRVVGTVAKMLSDDTEAEDVAQQVFVRVWRSAARYEPTAKFTTWLFTITRNLVFNELRRRKRHATMSLDESRDSEEDSPRHQIADTGVKVPDTSMLDDEMMAAIHRAIDELPETQRMAIVLRRYEETPYEDIARILNLSVPAVKSLLFRARTELREKLKQYLSE